MQVFTVLYLSATTPATGKKKAKGKKRTIKTCSHMCMSAASATDMSLYQIPCRGAKQVTDQIHSIPCLWQCWSPGLDGPPEPELRHS